MTSELARYKADGGAEVVLTRDAITNALVNGNGDITEGELTLFVEKCKAKRMNPFEGDCYLIKYGNNNPAQMVTGKGYFVKRAEQNPNCEGWEAGIYVRTPSGKIQEREGSMYLDGDVIVGGWARVYRKGYRNPIFESVPFHEYSTGKGPWVKMPATMARKVALCHALREAFPNEFNGLYSEEEMGQAFNDAKPVEATVEQVDDLPPVIVPKQALVTACREYAERFGLDARQVMAEQVQRADYPGKAAHPDVLDTWFLTVAEELDAMVPADDVPVYEETPADAYEGEYETDDIEF